MSISLRQLEILWSVAGARAKFEDMTVLLVKSQYPETERLRIVRGDGGIDAFQGALTGPEGVDVFQIKYFPTGLGESQKNQVRESFKTAKENVRLKAWTLCLPIDLSKDEREWFETWAEKQGGVIQPYWGATKLESLLMLPQNAGIRESFFKEERVELLREATEALKAIVTVPVALKARLETVSPHEVSGGKSQATLRIQVGFFVENVGPTPAKTWNIRINPRHENNLFSHRYRRDAHTQPASKRELLQGETTQNAQYFGFSLVSQEPLGYQLQGLANTTLDYTVVTENGSGESCSVSMSEVLDISEINRFERDVGVMLKNQLGWSIR